MSESSSTGYEKLLKVLLTPIDPPIPFVQNYLLILADFDYENFLKVLNLKIKGYNHGNLNNSINYQHSLLQGLQRTLKEEFLKHSPPTPSSFSSSSNLTKFTVALPVYSSSPLNNQPILKQTDASDLMENNDKLQFFIEKIKKNLKF